MTRAVAMLSIATLAIAASAAAQQPKLPVPDHIVIVFEENKSYTDVIRSKNAPYLNSLAKRGSLLTKFYAFHHPSQPNYLELFSGNEQAVCDDTCPVGPFSAPNLGASLFAAGKSFAGYAEGLPANQPNACNSGAYARKHCPWLDFSNVPSSAALDFSAFPRDAAGFEKLPTVSMVIPDLVHDMHSTPTGERSIPVEVKNGDTWLRQNLAAYADWAMTHNSLLIVTWDEDSSSYLWKLVKEQVGRHLDSDDPCEHGINTRPPRNHIATILAGQMVKPGSRAPSSYNHYDLLRTIEDMYGLTPIGGSAKAKDIAGIWK